MEQRLTAHETPQENGIAERLNCTLLECVRAMLHVAQLPKGLWSEALMYVVWLKNRTSTKALEKVTPYEALTRHKSDLAIAHEWGQRVWVHNPTNSKLSGRAKEAQWVGFDHKSRAHCIYWPDKVRVNVEHNIRFEHEHILMLKPPETTDPPTVTPINPAPITTASGTGLEPTDPLEGLEGPEPTPLEGCRARVKWPSAYACCILTSKGSTTRDASNQSLSHGIPGCQQLKQLGTTHMHLYMPWHPASQLGPNQK